MSIQRDDFEIKDGVLVKYRGKTADVRVPDGVTTIGGEAFSECNSISSIILPVSLTSIGDNAILFCENLVSINIPAGLMGVGRNNFFECDNLVTIQVDKTNRIYADLDRVLFNKTFTRLIRYPREKARQAMPYRTVLP
jgi:hypothetical protein